MWCSSKMHADAYHINAQTIIQSCAGEDRPMILHIAWGIWVLLAMRVLAYWGTR